MKDFEPMAVEAYSAYGAVTDFKNFQGNPMPEWGNLPEKIKDAWIAATSHVYFKTIELVRKEIDNINDEKS